MPYSDFLVGTEPLDEFESVSYHLSNVLKPIPRVLLPPIIRLWKVLHRKPSQHRENERSIKFLTESDWELDWGIHKRLKKLQSYGETRWSQDGNNNIDDSVNHKTWSIFPASTASMISLKANLSGPRTSSTLIH